MFGHVMDKILEGAPCRITSGNAGGEAATCIDGSALLLAPWGGTAAFNSVWTRREEMCLQALPRVSGEPLAFGWLRLPDGSLCWRGSLNPLQPGGAGVLAVVRNGKSHCVLRSSPSIGAAGDPNGVINFPTEAQAVAALAAEPVWHAPQPDMAEAHAVRSIAALVAYDLPGVIGSRTRATDLTMSAQQVLMPEPNALTGLEGALLIEVRRLAKLTPRWRAAIVGGTRDAFDTALRHGFALYGGAAVSPPPSCDDWAQALLSLIKV